MSSLYDGYANPRGRYASELERSWARRFKLWGWPAEYIGDCFLWADFKVDDRMIEIKPEGRRFIEAAAARGGNEFLIISGNPGFAEFWWVESPYILKVRPWPGTGIVDRQPKTFKEYIEKIVMPDKEKQKKGQE